MRTKLLKRFGRAFFTIFIVMNLSFVLIRLLPGGPAEYIRGLMLSQTEGASAERVNRLIEVYTNVNPEQSFWDQYSSYMVSLVHGDFGRSIFFDQPVSAVIADGLPWTLFVMSIGLLLMYLGGIVIGAALAYYEGSSLDSGASISLTVVNAVPYYIIGIVLIFLFGFQWEVFPTGGRLPDQADVGFTMEFLVGAIHHATLPIVSVALSSIGLIALQMRGNSIQVLGEDYLRVARLRGLPDKQVTIQYVARNAILPLYTNLLISIGFVFGGSIVLEDVFTYTGIGYYMLQAVKARDYPLMMGTFIMITVAVVAAILIADLTYGIIDPQAGGGEADAY